MPGVNLKSVIVGCAGPELLASEAELFAATQPLGFILFGRNCQSPAQVAVLTAALRAAVGRRDAPVLIDQEGGRVARMRPPGWHPSPAASEFGAVYADDPDRAIHATRLNAAIIGHQLAAIGVDVDCAPVADLRRPETTSAIGDRAYAGDPAAVARLAAAACHGFADVGVLPVIKHLPGHGRASVDSHLELPAVAASHAELTATDFAPFAALVGAGIAPLAMTAHVLYSAIDPDRPATQSPIVINDIIRGELAFNGFLFSDDISMQALSGELPDRTLAALDAGCDAVLHCSGVLAEMTGVLAAAPALTSAAAGRWQAARDAQRAAPRAGLDDLDGAVAACAALLAPP